MASELEAAKRDIKDSKHDELELDLVLESAKEKLAVAREANRHKEALQDKDLGYFGRFLGGPSQAPITAATLVTAACLLCLVLCVIASMLNTSADPVLEKAFTGFLTLASSALGFIIGTRSITKGR